MRILHVTPSYFPATYYGGPIFTTYALCNELARLPGIELRVLTSDMAGPKVSDRVPLSGFPMRLPAGYDVYFTRRIVGSDIAPGLLARLGSMIGWADAVLLTGTYSFPTIPTLLVCRLRNKPVVWSPRGALQASFEWRGARRPHFKRAFEHLCWLAKPRQCVLHVTAEVEKAASLARLPGFDAAIIGNAVEIPESIPQRVWKPRGSLRLMFISRVDPKKGLENLLQAITLLDADTTLAIYGTGEPSYVRSLVMLTVDLGLESRVKFHGHVDGEKKLSAFMEADLFVFPTHSENFGMVVAEALAHGVPAIVSDGAPWFDLGARRCGLWVDNAPESLARAIKTLQDADLESMGRLGRAWMREDFRWENRAVEMKDLFDHLLQNRKKS